MFIIYSISKSVTQYKIYTLIKYIMSKKALCIGINYKGTQNALLGCINDVYNVQNYLKKQGYSNFTIITDDTAVKPTKNNIFDALNNFVNSLSSGDTGVIWYSGHGTRVKDRNGDEISGFDSCICPIDFQTAGFIVDDDINNILKKVVYGANLNVVFDSCNSGTACDLKYNYYDSSKCKKRVLPKAFVPNDWTIRQSYLENKRVSNLNGNISLISGCGDNQTSSDTIVGGKPSGALTGYLLQVLEAYPNLSWGDLLSYLNCTLTIYGYSQKPQLSLSRNISIKSANIFQNKTTSNLSTKTKSREIFATGFDLSKLKNKGDNIKNKSHKHRKNSSFLGDIVNFIGFI